MSQAKGSATRVLIDFEDVFGTARTGANRRPVNTFFNSCDLKLQRPLNQAATIRGNRNPTDPFQGNKDVSGNVVVPVDFTTIGFWLKLAIGAPTTLELPKNDRKTGSPTLTIAGSGAATFSVGQTSAQVGDRVQWITAAGVVSTGYLTATSSSTSWTIKNRRAGTGDPATGTAMTVRFISQNKATSTPGNATVSGSILTFATSQASAAAGSLVMVDTTQYFLVSLSSADAWVVTAADGFAAADAGAAAFDTLEDPPRFEHTYVIDDTSSVPSFVLEKGFTDIATPEYFLYVGCKVNTFEVTLGGDGELVATLGIMGADETAGTSAYDTGGSVTAARTFFTERFQQFDASAKEGASLTTVNVLAEARINFTNNLDGSSYVIGGAGRRRALPEGIAGVGGNINALFEDMTIVTKAQENTESGLEFTLARTVNSVAYSLLLRIPELKYQSTSPPIPGPAGVKVAMDFQGYYADHANGSALVAILTNTRASY